MSTDRPKLSVVVAATDGSRSITGCIDSLREACDGISSEIVVTHPGDEPLAALLRGSYPDVKVVVGKAEALVPELWAKGLDAVTGEAVAFTTAHFTVPRGWAHALLDALARGATGAGGGVSLAPGSGLVDRAVFLLRYSAFIPPLAAGHVAEIAGDNAAYRRDAIDRHRAFLGSGFWEVEFHRLIHEERGYLELVPDATASFGRSFGFGTFLVQRFRHGRHYGEYRVSAVGASRARGIAAAPVVPFLLVLRTLRRVMAKGAGVGRALLSVPVLFAFAVAWAGGEAVGAATAPQVGSGGRA